MDASERLNLDEVRAPSLLSAHHLHRYELAARLCRGDRVLDLACGIGYGSRLIADGGAASVRGVDIDEAAIAQARDAFGGDGLAFDTGEALATLRALDPSEIDAIVAFEALEHLDRLDDVLIVLRDLAAAGVKLVLSVPNSRTFHEENPFHLTDFDYEEARAAFEAFEGVVLLYQHIAEGSVILGAGEGFAGHVAALEYGEPEYANTFIALVGFGPDAVEDLTAHLNLVATPNHNRYMLELQVANEELRCVNRRLGKGWLGKSDAAAASIVARYKRDKQRLAELETHLEWLQKEEVPRVVERYEKQIELMRAWHDAPRYRAVDAVRDRLLRLPRLGRSAEQLWRRVAKR